MAATDAEVDRLRRMVNEPTTDTYSDDDMADAIERYPLVDARGESPLVESTTTPGTLTENDDWTATYDLNAAAADIWSEKAAILAQDFDFAADGAKYNRSQAYDQAMQTSRYYQARRAPKTVTARPEPKVPEYENFPWVGNLPEVD